MRWKAHQLFFCEGKTWNFNFCCFMWIEWNFISSDFVSNAIWKSFLTQFVPSAVGFLLRRNIWSCFRRNAHLRRHGCRVEVLYFYVELVLRRTRNRKNFLPSSDFPSKSHQALILVADLIHKETFFTISCGNSKLVKSKTEFCHSTKAAIDSFEFSMLWVFQQVEQPVQSDSFYFQACDNRFECSVLLNAMKWKIFPSIHVLGRGHQNSVCHSTHTSNTLHIQEAVGCTLDFTWIENFERKFSESFCGWNCENSDYSVMRNPNFSYRKKLRWSCTQMNQVKPDRRLWEKTFISTVVYWPSIKLNILVRSQTQIISTLDWFPCKIAPAKNQRSRVS